MFDPAERTPEMKIDVSLGEFHDTHGKAHEAKRRLTGRELSSLSVSELQEALRCFEAGQRLTDAEDGPDFMYATSYVDEIRVVRAELERRSGR